MFFIEKYLLFVKQNCPKVFTLGRPRHPNEYNMKAIYCQRFNQFTMLLLHASLLNLAHSRRQHTMEKPLRFPAAKSCLGLMGTAAAAAHMC